MGRDPKVSAGSIDSKFISVKGFLVSEELEVCITNVYGLNTNGERDAFWEELDIHSWCSSMWCVGGNYTAVRYPSEKKGERGHTRGMEAFSDFVYRNEMTDHPLIRGQITWCSGQT